MRWILLCVAGLVALAGCADQSAALERSDVAEPSSTTLTTLAPTTTATSTTTAPCAAETGFSPFASAGPVTLHHPAAHVELVGFHQSNHEGARPMEPAPTATRPTVLESRERNTTGRTAADIVVPPDEEIRAPVTGTVKRAGGYILYCKYDDDFAVIEPDSRPGWEVKLLHIDGVQVRAGDRVEAGVTVIAPRPTRLPFESQVEEVSASPPWPHVHVEVVDPSIPNISAPGSGCN